MGRFRPRNLIDFIQIIKRRKLVIFFVTLVVLLAALTVILRMPPVYESRALVLVSGAIYDRQANGAQIAAVTEQLTSRANLESLVNKYNLAHDPAQMDATVATLAKGIKLDTKFRSDSQGFPESFTLTYRHNDPKLAQQIVTDLVATFNQANATLERQAVEEMREIQTEMADIDAKLSGITDKRAANASRQSAAGRAAGAMDRIRSERAAISSSVEQLSSDKFRLEQKISNQKRLIIQQQEIVRNAPPVDDNRPSGSYATLLRRKADLEGQVKQLSEQFTEKYPKLVAAREQLDEVNRQIAAAKASGEPSRAATTSPAYQELRNLQKELSQMETELEVINIELARKQQKAESIPPSVGYSPGPSVSSTTVGGDEYEYQSLRERYSALLRREEALRQFQPSTAGPGAPFFQLVDQPNLPQQPAAPNRMRLMTFALIMALGAALAVVVLSEIPRLTMINDERDVNYYLGVQVVALLPETLTVAERGRAQRQLFTRNLGWLVLGAAAIPVLAFILSTMGIFQILGK